MKLERTLRHWNVPLQRRWRRQGAGVLRVSSYAPSTFLNEDSGGNWQIGCLIGIVYPEPSGMEGEGAVDYEGWLESWTQRDMSIPALGGMATEQKIAASARGLNRLRKKSLFLARLEKDRPQGLRTYP